MVNISIKNNTATIALEGRIDSARAPIVEKEIFEALPDGIEKLIIDAENLEFISSAGLRVILRLRKTCHNTEIINALPDVYNVFEMTGFTEMLQIKKAYRKVSVEGCEVLGEGANGIVYRYSPEIAVKVYKNADALEAIHRETQLARRAFVLGIPTAIPFDVVKVGDSYGSVFELLDAKSISKLIRDDPDNTDKYVGEFVDLIKLIHSTKVDPEGLTDMKAVAVDWAEFLVGHLPDEAAQKLVSLVKAVPETDNLLHGDYHTNNVKVQNGEVLLIDMDTLSYGHPIFELGSMYNAFVGFDEVDQGSILKFLKLPIVKTCEIRKKSLALYLETEDEERIREVDDKAKIIGYTRLMRRTIRRNGYETERGRATIESCKTHLIQLVNKVNSLDF